MARTEADGPHHAHGLAERSGKTYSLKSADPPEKRRGLGRAGTVYSSKTHPSDKSPLLPGGAGKNFWMRQHMSEVPVRWEDCGPAVVHDWRWTEHSSRRSGVKTGPLRRAVGCTRQTEKWR